MGNARRRRINTCLEHLRALVPFATITKQDMASLLEQTVEYINTMHTVLNEDWPACLSKIYTIYQNKLEEYDFCTKNTKNRIASNGSCSSTVEPQATSPQIDHPAGYLPTPARTHTGDAAKRRCVTVEEWSNSTDAYQGLMNYGHYQNLTPHKAIPFEPAVDFNNNYTHHYPGIACNSAMSICRQPPFGANTIGVDPDFLLANQYAAYRNGEDPSQTALGNQHMRFYGMSPKVIHDNCLRKRSPTHDEAANTAAVKFVDQWSQNTRSTDTPRGKDRSPEIFSISNLVYQDLDDIANIKPSSSSSGYAEQQFEPKAIESPFPTDSIQKDNLAQNLLAPMDMSSPTGEILQSLQFVGINELLGSADRSDVLRGLSYGDRDTGLLRASSVSNMLNDVSTPVGGVPRGSYYSTEKKMTPYLSWLQTPCPLRSDEGTPDAESTSASAFNDSSKSVGTNDAGMSGFVI